MLVVLIFFTLGFIHVGELSPEQEIKIEISHLHWILSERFKPYTFKTLTTKRVLKFKLWKAFFFVDIFVIENVLCY